MLERMVGKHAVDAVVRERQPVVVQVQAQIAARYLVDVHEPVDARPAAADVQPERSGHQGFTAAAAGVAAWHRSSSASQAGTQTLRAS
jgi:hypothetical protein